MQTADQSLPNYPRFFRFPWHRALTPDQIRRELDRGARLTRYDWCVSFVLITVRCQSRIHLVRGDWSMFLRGYIYTLLSLLLGWWSLPWGPIETAMSVWANLNGGWDSTSEVEDLLEELRKN